MIVKGSDIFMVRGDSESFTVRRRIREEDGTLTPYPFEAGDIIEVTVRKRSTNPKLIYKRVTEFEEDGTAHIDIEHEDTCDLPFGTYEYDVQWTSSAGKVSTLVRQSRFILMEEDTY